MKEEKSFNKIASDSEIAKRIIVNSALAALGLPLITGGIRAFNALSTLPVPIELENQKGILEDLEYRLIKDNPDLFTKTQIKLIGEKKKKELIERIKKIKEEEKLKEKQENPVKENEEGVESVDNFITKNSSITKAGNIFKALLEIFASNPVYPFAIVAAPSTAYLLGQHLINRVNEDLADKYTKKYRDVAKARFYNDILDLQLFNKKKMNKEFKYEDLLELPLKVRKKLRDILLENSGKDYGPYLGLDVKYPELLPDKSRDLGSASIKTVAGSEKTAQNIITKAAETSFRDIIAGVAEKTRNVMGDILEGVKDNANSILGAAIVLGISYPILAFTATAIASYYKTKPTDVPGKLKEYLRKTRETTYIPEEITPRRLTGLTETIVKEVRPEDLLLGVLESKFQ